VLRTRRDQLEDLVAALAPLHATYVVFRQNEIQVDERKTKPSATRLASSFDDVQKRFADDPNCLAADTTLLRRETTVYLPRLVEHLREALRRAWLDYLAARGSIVDDDLIQVVAKVPQFAQAARAISDLRRAVNEFRERLPEQDAELREFHAKTDELGQAWATLEGDGLPGGVLRFLKAAGSTGAPVELLTAEVRRWLSERGVEGSFRVVIR
jgi:hypothetical protein